MGLRASQITEANSDYIDIVELVADQMSLDPSGQMGKSVTKQEIAFRTGVHVKR